MTTDWLAMHHPDLSVIIPTFKRQASLLRALDSIACSHWSPQTVIEILVVDNSPTGTVDEFFESWVSEHRNLVVSLLNEKNQGKSHALNLGLRNARGNVILIIDDDVVLDRHCLARHLEGYWITAFDALQGKILPGTDPAGRTANLAKLREYNIPYIDYGNGVCPLRGLTGTNMSFKREIFEKIGFFDTRLGPGAAGFSEDTEYSMRIREAGFKIGYTPDAVVYHELNPNRYGRTYNRMVEYRKGLSRSIYRHDSIVFRVMPNLVANCLRYGLYRVAGKSQKAYKTEGRIMKGCGYLMGKLRGIRSLDRHSQV